MAIMKSRCGDWLNLPVEALASEEAFKRWFKEHHWPVCRENPRARGAGVVHAKQIVVPEVKLLKFDPTAGYGFLELIPERPDDGLWRVLNRRTHGWLQVAGGDYLDITDLDNVSVIPQLEFATRYELIPEPDPAKP